ncbi:MAG: isoprenylcysteine carboxylmethyltransferase family protein [Tidjanibacter sp.]|nr:isoprenylcysteine carboxylmethyltransferase family protein [Tidjanibacter sp.]
MKTTQKGSLAVSALTKFLVGVVAVAALLFAPAGSLGYVGAWRLLAVLFIPMIIFGLTALILSPDLLARRLKSKEERTTQSGVVRLSGLLFIVGFVVAGLDFRFGWSNVSQTTIWIACGVFIVGYLLYAEVMRENVWLSRTIEVSEGQKVIDNGLYGVVRHPMYLATLLMFLAMPLVLGSWWAVVPFVGYVPVIVVRALDEEKLLTKELEGYADYCKRVRWHIVPFVW